MNKNAPADFIRTTATTLSALIVFALSACTSTPNAPPSQQQQPGQQTPAPVVTAPTTVYEPASTIVIQSRSSKAIMEDIISYRTGKGMKIRSKSNSRLEFMMPIARTTIPTEARMLYVLNQTEQGWRVTVRVFQITNPGGKKEKVREITAQVSDKLAEELASYAKISSKW